MFQVGDIVQVITVPKKYKQHDIAGATGIVKTVCEKYNICWQTVKIWRMPTTRKYVYI